MKRPRVAPALVCVVYVAAAGLAVGAVGWTVRSGVSEPAAAWAFGAVIVLGEAVRVPRGTGREGAPLATAGGLGYALLGPGGAGVAQVVAVVVAAASAGGLPRALSLPVGCARNGDAVARRILTVAFAAACCQPLRHAQGLTGTPYAAALLAVLALTALCDAVLAAGLETARTGHPYGFALRDEVWALAGIGPAVGAGGVVLALSVRAGGLWAVPVVAGPLLLTQMSLRGHAAVQDTYRQTIGSLARATEVAGYTRAGHARRVSELAVAVGRQLGLPARQLKLLEHAALMHDIGQLSLVDPVPSGATEPLPADRRRAIAYLGGEVVRRTCAPAEVALIVERQAHPYREQPLAGRIVRAVNAYEDLTGETAALDQRLAAMERLWLATAYDYDPRVVEALTRVLARHPTRAWLDARGDGKESG